MENAADQSIDPLDSLRDWSRWLIAAGVAAVGGCLAFATPDMEAAQHNHITTAIFAFLSSVVFAAILGLVVSASKYRWLLSRRLLWIVFHLFAWICALLQVSSLAFGAIELTSWVKGLPTAESSESPTAVEQAKSAADEAEQAAVRAEAAANRAEAIRQHINEQIRAAMPR
jgi:hypothetical protein